MTASLFEWECERLVRYLKTYSPAKKFVMILDNAPSHKLNKYENLDFVFLEPGTTGILQPLDRCVFAVLKSQYRNWLSQHKLLTGTNIKQEMAVRKMAELFSKLSQDALNYAWRSTGVDKFAALPSESPNLSSDEVINVRIFHVSTEYSRTQLQITQ